MFTPFTREDKAAPEHVHNASFDYSEMGDTVKDVESKQEEEFEFPVADSTSHTPPLLGYEPPELAPEDLTPPPSPPPLPPSSPPRCGSPIIEETATIVEAYTEESVPFASTPPVERNTATHKTLDEGFQHVEKAISQPEVSGDQQSVAGSESQRPISELYAKVIKLPTTLEEEPLSLDVSDQGVTLRNKEEEEGQRPISELYAKVNKPPRETVNLRKKEGERTDERPVSELYAKVKKVGRSGGDDGEGELVWKAPSADNVMSVHVAEVNRPKRSSMPPDSVPAMQFVPSSPAPPPLPPPLPPKSPGYMFDVTFDEDWQKLQENETSLQKLQVH